MLHNRQLLYQLPPALIGCALAVVLSTSPGSFTHLFGVQANACGCYSLHVGLTRVQIPTHNVPSAPVPTKGCMQAALSNLVCLQYLKAF